MRAAKVMLVSLLLLTSLFAGSVFQDRIELEPLLRDPKALSELVILYSRDNRTSYFFGSGKVIKQSFVVPSTDLVPTCRGTVGVERMQRLVRTFIDKRFFELPQKTYVLFFVDTDSQGKWQLHEVILDDGHVRAQRSFDYGTYEGKKEPVPQNFVAIERTLQDLEAEALGGAPCGAAPILKLPPATRPQANSTTKDAPSLWLE